MLWSFPGALQTNRLPKKQPKPWNSWETASSALMISGYPGFTACLISMRYWRMLSVAGMEGALTSVVGGLVSCPVVGVPTSVGYGANFQGISALLAMLNACAPGIAVVNIDNGFGAAVYAHLILRRIQK